MPLLLSLALAACALGERESGDAGSIDPDFVARDLIFALSQLPELEPANTTVQLSARTDDPFGSRIEKRLREAGYGVRATEPTENGLQVRYGTERTVSENGERWRYRLAIGPLAAERDYAVKERKTVPGSRMLLVGTDVQAVTLDDAGFGASTTNGPVLADAGFGDAVRRNIYSTLTSNYAPIFIDYDDVREDVLVFPNDSLVLGEHNKRVIEEYAGQLDPATDLISVLGCSHGKTELDNGNALLALGRANRVKEGLLFAGIDHELVLEEGCWASTPFDRMPRRGVVLTLKRRDDVG